MDKAESNHGVKDFVSLSYCIQSQWDLTVEYYFELSKTNLEEKDCIFKLSSFFSLYLLKQTCLIFSVNYFYSVSSAAL
jgi:hypothetical protein